MARSEKPEVIERIYDSLLDPKTGKLSRTVVTSNDVVKAIEWCAERHKTKLSTKNPANFVKDIIRGKGASGMWPDRLKEARMSARQVTGDGNVFEFVPYAEGQIEPFPDRFGYHAGVQRHRIQSISVPLATKALGRNDETYLIQIAVKLAILETHFALFSQLDVMELFHLQIGIKLRRTEIDSLYAATYRRDDGSEARMIVTVEAKKKNQRILEEQIEQQFRAAFTETDVDLVVPVAMTIESDGIYLAEFKGVRRDELANFVDLELASETLYELVPEVRGIS